MLFCVDAKYLQSLDNPEEAINNQVWDQWRNSIYEKCEVSEDMTKILSKRINDVAPKLGIRWLNQKDDHVKDILNKPYSEIKSAKHKGSWYKKHLVLTFAKLLEADESTLQRVAYTEPTYHELKNQEKEDRRIKAKKNILGKIDSLIREGIYVNSYFEIYNEFVKYIIKHITITAGYSPKDLRKYLQIIYDRYYRNKSTAQIADHFDIDIQQVNSIINKYAEEFQEIFSDSNDFKRLCRKFDNMYQVIYDKLGEKVNEDDRFNLLMIMKNFQQRFITDKLGEVIS
ncbi:MAG: hypothetical protein K9H48_07890 [Melioribacteraceae bacterium]|nr:hypothetical protein [Melioribacteraceae bacterium]